MDKIILAGIVYEDRRTEDRLTKLLNHALPEIITVEYDEKRLKMPKFSNECLHCNPPFLRIVQNHSEKNKVPLFYIDDLWEESANPSVLVSNMLARTKKIDERVAEYSSGKNIPGSQLSKILFSPFLDLNKFGLEINPDIPYQIYEKHSEGEINDSDFQEYLKGNGIIFGERDKYMADKIKEIKTKNPGKRILNVGGIFHLVEDAEGKSLYSLLKEFEPLRGPLNQLDFL